MRYIARYRKGEKVYEEQDGVVLLDKAERSNQAFMVMPDIQPYRSMIDGSQINSRSQHKAHLRDHGCIEIGNEKITPKPLTPPPGLKETLVREVNKRWR